MAKLPSPNEIDTSQPLHSRFGAYEAEVAAQWIVRYCQFWGNEWQEFSHEDIERFFQSHNCRNDEFKFCCLIKQCDTDIYHNMAESPDKEPYIVFDTLTKKYQITYAFITQCAKKVPA